MRYSGISLVRGAASFSLPCRFPLHRSFVGPQCLMLALVSDSDTQYHYKGHRRDMCLLRHEHTLAASRKWTSPVDAWMLRFVVMHEQHSIPTTALAGTVKLNNLAHARQCPAGSGFNALASHHCLLGLIPTSTRWHGLWSAGRIGRLSQSTSGSLHSETTETSTSVPTGVTFGVGAGDILWEGEGKDFFMIKAN